MPAGNKSKRIINVSPIYSAQKLNLKTYGCHFVERCLVQNNTTAIDKLPYTPNNAPCA